MKLAITAALICIAALASAAEPTSAPAQPPKPTAEQEKILTELREAGSDPDKLAAVQERAAAAGIKIQIHGPATNCYFMRTTRPLPDTTAEDAAKGLRLVPLQARGTGVTTVSQCVPGGELLKAGK